MSYPSDLSDSQWKHIDANLPTVKVRGSKRKYEKRALFNALFYLVKTGCQWRYLPSDFPPWKSVYYFYRDMEFRGVFEKLNQDLREKIRTLEGRYKDPSLVCIDSQSVRGDINLEEKGIDGNKKVKGRKRHVAVDVLGLILLCAVTAANVSDIHSGREFINELSGSPRLEKILLDKGYQSLEGQYGGFKVEISSKDKELKGFVPVHKRWVVERTFSWLNRQRRLCRDYEVNVDNQKAMIFVGMSKIMLNRLDKYENVKLS